MVTAHNPADAIHTDVPFARLAGRPIHHGLPVLVIEALSLGDAGQLTLVWGINMATKQAIVVFQSPLAVAEAFPTKTL